MVRWLRLALFVWLVAEAAVCVAYWPSILTEATTTAQQIAGRVYPTPTPSPIQVYTPQKPRYIWREIPCSQFRVKADCEWHNKQERPAKGPNAST